MGVGLHTILLNIGKVGAFTPDLYRKDKRKRGDRAKLNL